MSKQSFTTGQVLTAAQVNSLQANDYNQTVSVKTASYVLVAADKGTRIEFNTSGSVTCTVNSGLFDAGDTLVIQNRGAGIATVTAGTATVNTSASLAISQYGQGILYFVDNTSAIFFAGAPGDITGVTTGATSGLTGGVTSGTADLKLNFASKGQLAVGTGSGTTDFLNVGTNGYTLVADSSVSPQGLKWAVDPVADVITTAGDLIYGTAADTVARLALGTAGQVLKVNSGATAPEWAAPAGGGANWSLLNTGGTALTGATSITVSSISGADKIMVLIAGASADASAGFYLRLNADSGNNYSRFGYESSGTIDVSNQSATSGIALCDLSNNAASVAAGYYLFSGCNASGLKIYNSVGSANAAGGSGQKTFMQGGFYNSASTISSVTLHSTSGNFDAGTIYVYTSA